MEIENIDVGLLIPYDNNPRLNDGAVDGVAASIKEFGFKVPLVIDANNVIVCGHTRLKAALKLGCKSVPCIRATDLSDEQIKAFRLADNKVSEASQWDIEKLNIELEDIESIEMEDFGFPPMEASWFKTRERNDDSRQEGNEEYNEFLDKFELAKTTDDCYTPDNVYNAVAEWVAKEYGLKRENFFRPFFPGGDYQSENYTNKIVVDNPPFSILSEIEQWYNDHGVKYFLFAPALTTFPSKRRCCAVCVGHTITYENGAKVATNFVTNLEDLAARTAPDLCQIIKAIDKENSKGKELPKYDYPPNVVTATMLNYLTLYGQDFKLRQEDVSDKIGELDSQKPEGKGLFGGGFLISEKAAAEKAAAEKAAAEKAAAQKWPLSERELEIIRNLGK